MISLYGCQQVLIHADKELKGILEFICSEANKLSNCAVYYARQIWFKAKRYITKFELDSEMKSNRHFQTLYSQAAQQLCRSVYESFASFKQLNALYNRGELADKPRPPKYRKNGFNLVSYPKQALRLKDGQIRIPLGSQVKVWFKLDSFTLPMPSNLRFEDIKELRILPRNRCFYAEFIYKTNTVKSDVDKSRVLGIDHGLNNWLTCVSNVGTSFIIDGRHLKSLNRWYNKRVSTIKENKPQGFWSNNLADITEKRNRQIRDAINKGARIVINHCLDNRIGRVVFGWGQGIKQEIDLGKKRNQQFVQIPTARLKARIEQLCQQHGIEFVETEEANTSAASFVDGDMLPKHGEKPDSWKSSGRRVKRGLFRTAMNWCINADCNGAANIIRKVSTKLGLDLSGVSRGALTHPTRIYIWVTANKKQSNEALTRRVASS
ncbi:IS200/IS605 family element transposase accessory protein TnpB (plasmid) [Trichormus variabilis ARAD]|uniref:IS200/IS605 family element transposase accessory protein TnpB n=1 Tax=Trichormus variabilis N2B TaxID=2681315 RepID=A0ABR6SHZ6_ANAVA|nr:MULTISPECIES: RNA-guided endonuclease TnpB family protein [Nostocaceae]MBC1218328.1 IS200/IS605 family element transposase accessory protein TnpB [Trichormus variabilis ARAD]MBC1259457.1 IS200/IS605 family element transposase accessory protein TnpB [Trichormus variabilis V5]MBC1271035.1 IS200/IS605 family element transposase accessory protein TnpB [Trichormus variabilis FSR]MBC1306010.1 IS200/IS605 family element transposase accessory protein TnpB [Trichormus variabilis N2B]MBC1314968.1 IS2